jgi:hypothetical protein
MLLAESDRWEWGLRQDWAGFRERRAFQELPTVSGQRADDLRREGWNVVSGGCKK